jgi:phage-related baseplate assembly protein
MTDPTDRKREMLDNAGARDLYKETSTELVQQQTRRRIERENETYRQQQTRLKRDNRRDILCAVLVVIGLFAVVVGRLIWSTRP